MMAIYFWQNILSPHQASYIRSLSEIAGTESFLFAQEGVPQWRRDIGWAEPDFGRTIVKVEPDESLVRKTIQGTRTGDIHLFSGMRAYPMVWNAFLLARHSPARLGLISEPSNWQGIAGMARVLRARADRARYGGRIDFILAIGHLALQWFRMAGYDGGRLYPFAYTTAPPAPFTQVSAAANDVVQFLFIGQCIRRKGVDLLLSALEPLTEFKWQLKIVGDGEERKKLEAQSDRLGINGKVVFMGSKPNDEAMRILEASDALVLPSRWDGWGAVVNEAVMRGIPVICSNTCGAADLLRDPKRGETFRSESVAGLREVLRGRIEAGKLTSGQSACIREWARAVSGPEVAKYVLEVLSAVAGGRPKPAAPWLAA